MSNRIRLRVFAALALVACLAAAGCGSGSGSGSSGGSSSSTSSASGSGGAGKAANLSAAKAVVQKYSKPTPFPVTTPLTKWLAPGRRIGYLDCSAPFCALLGQLYGLATKTLGTSPVVPVKAGASADQIQSALGSILANKPAALLLPAVDLGSLGNSLTKFDAAGIPVIGGGVMGTPAQGIDAPINGPANYEIAGKILADWAIINGGSNANIAWYEDPELDFTPVITSSFKAELSKNCPACTARIVNIPVATIGSTAPSMVVSDLQAHPNTKIALFDSLETATGLPAALKGAGIKIKIAGDAPVPANLQDLKTGGLTAAVGLDAGVFAFTQLDAAVRLATKQPLTPAERIGTVPQQLITAADLPTNVSNGYSAYPDFIQRFVKLWAKAHG